MEASWTGGLAEWERAGRGGKRWVLCNWIVGDGVIPCMPLEDDRLRQVLWDYKESPSQSSV